VAPPTHNRRAYALGRFRRGAGAARNATPVVRPLKRRGLQGFSDNH
jgi:hypothetical protein